jgi:hypothetical protein
MAGWCWFPAEESSVPRLARKQPQGHVRRRSIHSPIQQGCSLAAGGGRPFGAELLNRLDVSKYYVIRTIIILDTTVEGYGVLELLRESVRVSCSSSMRVSVSGVTQQRVQLCRLRPSWPWTGCGEQSLTWANLEKTP